MRRTELSRPWRLAVNAALLGPSDTLLDYGCGRGDDVRLLRALGHKVVGWDPVYCPDSDRSPADVVNLGYVVNVIEDPAERRRALLTAWSLAKSLLIVSARLDFNSKSDRFEDYGDGYVTARGTFQKFYTQQELREWIEATLGEQPVAAGPGIFFVFRDPESRQSYAAGRYRRRAAMPSQRLSDVLFEQHQDLLQPLMEFYAARGRLPSQEELPNGEQVVEALGSIRRAFGIVRRVTGDEQWRTIEVERRQDLLVYLALARFDGRPKFSELPQALQLDVKALFGPYTRACEQADALLFSVGNLDDVSRACEEAPVGKLTADALYVHTSALDTLPAVLRVYEGCASGWIGQVEGANIVKLSRRKAQVSYLSYPDFDENPHPMLRECLIVSLHGLDVLHRSYTDTPNPPILHRKELFVPEDYPLRAQFARLTREEERAGLLDDPSHIGTLQQWQQRLRAKGVVLRGHRVLLGGG